jgi:hypothetical protein
MYTIDQRCQEIAVLDTAATHNMEESAGRIGSSE